MHWNERKTCINLRQMRAFQVQCEDFKLKKDPNIIKEREEEKGKL